MITLYGYATSPNVLKVRILLKEGAIPYEERDIHQEHDESCSARFLELSPTGAVPAIEESDTGVELFESSAILLYLAERNATCLPKGQGERAEVYKWLIFESASVSPLFESIYKLYMESGDWVAPALAFHQQQLRERIQLLENHLENVDYVAQTFSIADIALFPMLSMMEDFIEVPASHYPKVGRWLQRLAHRPAFQEASSAVR
jgi:GSH-dependent disulfide-bond oxidoreductase